MSTRLRFLLSLALVCVCGIALTGQATIGEFTRIILGGVAGAGTVDILTGTGTPESAVTGTVGDVFLRTDGGSGTTLYVKESGTGNTGWSGVGAGSVTASSTTTFTNKTLNAESTGNVVTIPFTVWAPAGSCQNATAASTWDLPTTNPAVAACATGTNTQLGTLDFADGASTLSAQWGLLIPDNFTSTVDIRLTYFTSATSGNLKWFVAAACIQTAATIDPSFNTAATSTVAVPGTTNSQDVVELTSLTITNCADGGYLQVKVSRNPADAADTLAATARLLGMQIKFRRAL